MQVKLYKKNEQIENLGNKEIYDAIGILITKHDLLPVFFTLLDYLKKECHLNALSWDVIHIQC